MARTGITQEQVFDAVEAMIESGHSVTVSSVRDQLGSGSYSTISTHLAAWRETNDNRKAMDHPDMPESVDKAFKKIWGIAWQEAQVSIQAEREALTLAKKQMEQMQADMGAEITRLEAELHAQGDELEKVGETLSKTKEALRDAENTNNGLKIENARLDERAKSSENRAGELKTELDKLHSRLQEATANIKTPQSGKKADE